MNDEPNLPTTNNTDEFDFAALAKTVEPHIPTVLKNMRESGSESFRQKRLEHLTKMSFIFGITIAIFFFSYYLIEKGELNMGVGILTHAVAILVGAVLSSFSGKSNG